ncbi:HD domain-containing protein [Micromonospora chersina]
MNSRMKIKKAYEYMKSFHQHDTTGHDIAHVERVYNNACYIAKRENITDTLVIELSSLLHDTVDSKLTDEILAYDQLKQFLSTLDLSSEISQQVLYIIKHMSYRAGKNNHVKLSIDGEIVRDADRLDAIGAIGIARTFQFSGHFGEPMWTETKLSNVMNLKQSIEEMIKQPDYEPMSVSDFQDALGLNSADSFRDLIKILVELEQSGLIE